MRKTTNDKKVSNSKIYTDLMQSIKLSAIFNRVYIDKISCEIINTKLNNQINSIKISINQINHKFTEKSKNYDKVKEHITESMEKYENVLKIFCDAYDEKIEQYILKKVELENKLLKNIIKENIAEKKKSITLIQGKKKVVTEQDKEEKKDAVIKLEKEIKKINNIILKLNEEKKRKLYEAMEMGGKEISTQIRRPRKIKNIAKFFSNKFNTYKTIEKNIIIPFDLRIDEFENKQSNKKCSELKEFDLSEFEKKLEI